MRILMILTVLLGTLLSGKDSPAGSDMAGTWGYCGFRTVFMDSEGAAPDDSDVDACLKGLGASHSNCTISFMDGHKASLRLGEKCLDFEWSIDAATKRFKASVAMFSIKGYLVEDGGRLVLIFRRPDLFMVIRYLCSPAGRRHITRLGELLDCTKGLSVAIEFSK